MASITCTIDGQASSAYMKSGSPVGTPPTIPRYTDRTYRIVFTPDFSAWQHVSISAYNDTNYDGISMSVSIVSGSNTTWDDYSEYFDTKDSFVADVTFAEYPTYIYISPSSPYYPSGISFTFNGSTGYYSNGEGNYRWNINSLAPTLSTPSAPNVSQNGTNYVFSWDAALGSNGSGSVTYDILVDGDYAVWSAGTAKSLTHSIPSDFYGVSHNFSVRASYAKLKKYSSDTSFTAIYPYPTITNQPSITSMNPTSGSSVTINWSAATVTNLGSYTIYYQYFVGPSSTYSDSYHVGTTTNLYATITEESILSKCGSDFEGTCYVFVRAYWSDGTTNGGWTAPTGKAFSYTPHRTVKYFNGSSWVECIPYYFNGSSWIECIPYYFNGSSWVECSH